MTTGWQASRIAIGGFLAPFLFVYQPALLFRGEWWVIGVAFVSALIGISALCAAIAGHMFGPLGWVQRIVLAAVSLATITSSLLVAAVTGLALLAWGIWDYRRTGGGPQPVAPPLAVSIDTATVAPPPTVME